MNPVRKRTFTLAAAAVTLLIGGFGGEVHAVPIQNPGNGHWYDAIATNGTVSWSQASAAATALGGHLATITSAAENTFVYNSVALTNPAVFEPASSHPFRHGPWLGGFQDPLGAEPAGGWSWVTGEAFSFTFWDAGEPNNSGGNEEFLHYHGLSAPIVGGWNDVPDVNPHVRGYIVEWNTDPNAVPAPGTIALLGLGLAMLGLQWRRAV